MNAGFRIGRIRGIEIVLDWSLLIIFFLVSFSLGAGVIPAWHPDWSLGLIWLVALIAAVLFFVSLLLHELSHALVGRALGVDIRCITLFVFGGMAQLEREPHTWRSELWMAVVGPVASLLIGFACMIGGVSLAVNDGFDVNDPVASLDTLGPVATVLFWLGPINVALALFNLVPGFPLDGGRVLRAALWGFTGDLYRATRWASAAGRIVGMLLMVAGIAMIVGIRLPFFGSGAVGGLWLALIGWFLHNAAAASYVQLLAQRSLADMPVSRLMLSDIATVSPEMPVSTFVDDYLIAHEQRSFPVVQEGRLVGLAGFEQARRLPPAVRSGRTVGEIMTPASDLIIVEPGAAVADALNTISRRPVDLLTVVADGQVRGILRREDILNWLALRGEEEAVA